MEIFIFIISTIVFLYSLMMLALIAGFYRIPSETYKTEIPVNSFSVIVPFRNEEENLEMLIESLNRIEYPLNKFEVIFVNDNSEDQSLEIANKVLKFTNFKYAVISQDENIQGKKAALTLGIENASYPWIITTDADCTVKPLWLKLYDQKLEEKDVKMLAGSVNFTSIETGFIDAFQKLDLSALIGVTIGSFGLGKPLMCNGANLLFSKDVFYEVSGYDGNMEIASGDDVFLMEKIVEKYPDKIRYLKANEATVNTMSMTTVKAFFNQRLRWAAKSSEYGSKSVKMMSLFVGLANTLLIVLFVLAILGISLRNVLPIIALKLVVNFWLIKIASNFLKDKKKLIYYPIISVVYPFYVLYVAVLSQFTTFEWKGRTHKK